MKNTGRKGSKARAEVERNKLHAAQRLAEGASRTEVMKELGVTRQTIWAYLRKSDIDWAALNATALAPLKKKLAEQLSEMADDVLAGRYPPKVVEAWRGLMGDLAKIAGLNAPTTSVTAHIRADGTGRFHKFVQAAAGLTDAQLETVFQFALKIPREQLPMPAGPPPLMLKAGETK
jgi:hypothetical protein